MRHCRQAPGIGGACHCIIPSVDSSKGEIAKRIPPRGEGTSPMRSRHCAAECRLKASGGSIAGRSASVPCRIWSIATEMRCRRYAFPLIATEERTWCEVRKVHRSGRVGSPRTRPRQCVARAASRATSCWWSSKSRRTSAKLSKASASVGLPNSRSRHFTGAKLLTGSL